ncbi:MAG TPA: amidohydrolase [Gemmatimonadales bacterium]
MRRWFVNGRVFTGQSETDLANAFAVRAGRFDWVGDLDDAPDGAVDLRGRTVIPGLLDVHTHPNLVSLVAGAVPCTIPGVRDIPGMIDALRRHPDFGRGPTDWILGFGYDESKLAEGRTPTAEDLDRVSTTQPVHVLRSDCHSGICNTRALELAGITRETPDPEGARIGRHGNGEPNGILEELGANDLVMRARSSRGMDERVRSIAALGAHYLERGTVAIAEMMADPVSDLEVYRRAAAEGLTPQVALYLLWPGVAGAPLRELADADRTGRVRVAGVKLFADGTISGRTAWTSRPYRTGGEGYSTLAEADLAAATAWARRNGVQVAVHAMGDRAIGRVIDYFAPMEPWLGDAFPSVRIEHASLVSAEHLSRIRAARMTFGIATQPIFLFAEQEAYAANLAPEVLRDAYPIRTCYDAVGPLALSADAPCTTWADPDDVFVSIRAAVTRRAYNGADIGTGEAITVPQALLLYTARAARVAPFEGGLGRIAAGGEASFVVLDRDVFSIDPAELDRTVVAETWLAGSLAYSRAPSGTAGT